MTRKMYRIYCYFYFILLWLIEYIHEFCENHMSTSSNVTDNTKKYISKTNKNERINIFTNICTRVLFMFTKFVKRNAKKHIECDDRYVKSIISERPHINPSYVIPSI